MVHLEWKEVVQIRKRPATKLKQFADQHYILQYSMLTNIFKTTLYQQLKQNF